MAKAHPIMRCVTSYVPGGVSLDLTQEEAVTLALALGHIGGDPRFTARKHADTIGDALHGAGYGFNEVRDVYGDPFVSSYSGKVGSALVCERELVKR